MQHSPDPRRHDITSEVERGAYNQAFSELGLEWYWDARTYDGLKAGAGAKDCVQAYVEAHHPHLLRAYDGNSLAAAVEDVRRRLSEALAH